MQHFSLTLFSHCCTCISDMKCAVSEGTGPEAQGNVSECQLAVTQGLAKAAICPSPDQGKGAGFGRVRRAGRRGRNAVGKQIKTKANLLKLRQPSQVFEIICASFMKLISACPLGFLIFFSSLRPVLHMSHRASVFQMGEINEYCRNLSLALFSFSSVLLAYILHLAAVTVLTSQLMKTFYIQGGLHEMKTTFTSRLLLQVARP